MGDVQFCNCPRRQFAKPRKKKFKIASCDKNRCTSDTADTTTNLTSSCCLKDYRSIFKKKDYFS